MVFPQVQWHRHLARLLLGTLFSTVSRPNTIPARFLGAGMIRRSPAEYYIKYLMCHPDGYTEEDIKHTVREHQLDWPGGTYFIRLKRRVKPPKPFYPNNDSHRASYRFLTAEKIHTMFHKDRVTLGALKLLNTPRAKEALESMVLVEDHPSTICSRMAHMKFTFDPDILRRYLHFFFNLSLVDSTEMRALLRLRVDNMIDDGDTVMHLKEREAMKSATYMDPRHNAANSPILPLAGMMNQIRYGFLPSQVDMARILRAAEYAAGVRTIESLAVTGPQSPSHARDFSIVARNMGELLEIVGSPDDQLQRDVMAMLLDTDSSQPPLVEVLSEGQHTADMQLLRERNEEDD